MRFVAAEAVCVGHGLIFFAGGLGSWPRIQNIGVLVFFVLSGFLITATLWQHSEASRSYGFGRYMIDRFARIYSALVPALVFIAIVDGLTLQLTGEPTIARYYNWPTLLANLGMLQSYRGVFDSYDMLQWSPFGSASPLWTLSIEWHIYVFAGAAFFVLRRRRLWPLLLPLIPIFAQTPARLLFGSFSSDGLGQSLFALWLAGAALFALLSAWRPPLWLSITILATSLATYATMLRPEHEYDATTYPALVGVIGALIALTQRTSVLGASKAIRTAAGYSFTLYLIHHTIMLAVILTMPRARGWLWACLIIMGCNALAYVLARPFEMKHRAFADWLAGLPVRFRHQSRTAPARFPYVPGNGAEPAEAD
ncbi:acyltransferase [Bradyrhizobium sp.]|uniref:acyltransferase family protein n=1 Tax=Bradyrhizobium sp. TaxID=376 RepID=UPI0025C171CB|nr:acyltransferase [Bradyrhizobium sp.]